MSNGFDATILKRFVGEIEKHHDQIASYKGEHAQRVKSVQEMISDIYDRAKDSGIPKKQLKAVIRERDLLKKIEGLREDMEDEQAETFDQIKFALGMLSDLPLGEVALKRSDAIDSLTDDEALAPDPEAIAPETNTAALRAGLRAVK
jgi:uncharacterized protein (UPF0335 family)